MSRRRTRTPRDTHNTERRRTDSRCTTSDERVAAGGAAASSASPPLCGAYQSSGVEEGEGGRGRERGARGENEDRAREGWWCAVFGTAATEGGSG